MMLWCFYLLFSVLLSPFIKHREEPLGLDSSLPIILLSRVSTNPRGILGLLGSLLVMKYKSMYVCRSIYTRMKKSNSEFSNECAIFNIKNVFNILPISINQFCEILFDAGVDQHIIDGIRSNHKKVYLNYDLSNQIDQDIMRNKISAISEKTFASENVYDQNLLSWSLKILQTKH